MPRGKRFSTLLTASRTSWAAASILRSILNVSSSIEELSPRDAPQLVDALDRGHRVFQDLRDLGLHLFRRRAGQRGAHVDGGQVHPREAVDAQLQVRGGAGHDQRHDQHQGENRAFDADFSQPLHGLPGVDVAKTQADGRGSLLSTLSHSLATRPACGFATFLTRLLHYSLARAPDRGSRPPFPRAPDPHC